MNDRLTKQQLKEDALVAQTAKAADFASTHGRAIAGGVVVFVIVVGAVLFLRSSRASGNDQAAQLLSEARTAVQQGNLSGASLKLDELVSSHGGTNSGKQGILMAADLRHTQGQNQEAADLYRRALKEFGDEGILGAAARRGLAVSLENLGQFGEAADLYAELAKNAPNSQLRADLKMSEARARNAAGQSDAAQAIYEELSRLDDNPRVAQTAKLRLAEVRKAG